MGNVKRETVEEKKTVAAGLASVIIVAEVQIIKISILVIFDNVF